MQHCTRLPRIDEGFENSLSHHYPRIDLSRSNISPTREFVELSFCRWSWSQTVNLHPVLVIMASDSNGKCMT